MRCPSWTACPVIILGLLWQSANAVETRVIYGADDRQDYYQVSEETWKTRANSTVALIRTANITIQGPTANIKTVSYGAGMGLCKNEPFYEQETAAFCSGFLVAPDTIVTAGHCIRNQSSCDSTKFVFGFRLNALAGQPRAVDADMVFGCKSLVHSVANPSGEDFAIIKLDREVTHTPPLPFRTQGTIGAGEGLTVIGHPAGLPLKVAGGGAVRAVKAEHLVTNLDTYGGNSGSAVFNSVTGELEGILVRGEMDFIYKDGCRISNVCDAAGCRGEDVTLFERVRLHL